MTFRLRFMPSNKKLPLFSLGSIDVSLSTRRDTLDNSNRGKLLTDASYALLVPLEKRKVDWIEMDRLPFAGAVFKVFNTRSFLGFQAGAMEMTGSRLEGSSVTFSLLRDLYPRGEVDTTLAKTEARTNVLVEFFLRVPGAQFLDRLRVRGRPTAIQRHRQTGNPDCTVRTDRRSGALLAKYQAELARASGRRDVRSSSPAGERWHGRAGGAIGLTAGP